MKKHSLFVLIFILLAGLAYSAWAQGAKLETYSRVKDEEALTAAFQISNFNMDEFNINTSLILPDTFWSIDRMEKIQWQLIEALKLKGKIEVIEYEDGYAPHYFEDLSPIGEETIFLSGIKEKGYYQLNATAVDKEGNMTVIILHSTQIEGEEETHIIVDMVQNKRYKDIVELSHQSKEILQQFGKNVETTLCILGSYDGKLTMKEQRKAMDEVLFFLNAKKIEDVEEEFYSSVTAYTPLIQSYIFYAGKKVNLQLASRYNEFEDRTYLWIANPLITTTY